MNEGFWRHDGRNVGGVKPDHFLCSKSATICCNRAGGVGWSGVTAMTKGAPCRAAAEPVTSPFARTLQAAM
jgi:hypothetical protein